MDCIVVVPHWLFLTCILFRELDCLFEFLQNSYISHWFSDGVRAFSLVFVVDRWMSLMAVNLFLHTYALIDLCVPELFLWPVDCLCSFCLSCCLRQHVYCGLDLILTSQNDR